MQARKAKIAAGKHRIDEIDRLIAKLYEDNFCGKLSDERYSRMAAKYEAEQAGLMQSVSAWEKEATELERETVDVRLLLTGLREYSSMETLTRSIRLLNGSRFTTVSWWMVTNR